MLRAAERQHGNKLMHDNSFHHLCVVKGKCVTTSGSGSRDVLLVSGVPVSEPVFGITLIADANGRRLSEVNFLKF